MNLLIRKLMRKRALKKASVKTFPKHTEAEAEKAE